MTRVVVLLDKKNRRFTIIDAHTGEILKRSGTHKSYPNCSTALKKFIAQTKETHEYLKVVHV